VRNGAFRFAILMTDHGWGKIMLFTPYLREIKLRPGNYDALYTVSEEQWLDMGRNALFRPIWTE